MKILGISGSPRRNGNTELLVKEALQYAGGENEINLISLVNYKYRGCIGCEACRSTLKCVLKDDMSEIYKMIDDADAIILGSPTYFYNVSSEVKAFLDRLYCYEVFDAEDRSVWLGALAGKMAVTIAVCEQKNERDTGFTSQAMSMSLEALGYKVVENLKVLHSFKKGDVLKDEKALINAKEAGCKLRKALELKKEIEEKMLNYNEL